MNPESPSNIPESHTSQHGQGEINIVKLFFLILSNWYWFVIALILILTAAWQYNRYAPPIWRVTALVLIGEDHQDQAITDTDQLLRGFGLRPGMQTLDNQFHIFLTSWSIVDQTLVI